MNRSYPAKFRYQSQGEAAQYDRKRFSGVVGSYVNNLELNAVRKCLAVVGRSKLGLDLAAGTGRITRVLQESTDHVVAADVSRAMLIRSGAETPLVCDAELLPFADDSFDIVTCVRFFGHLPKRVRVGVLSEMSRITRQYVVIAYYHRRATWPIKRLIAGVRGKNYPRFLVDDETFGAELDAASLRHIMSVGTGFQVSSIVHLCERRQPV